MRKKLDSERKRKRRCLYVLVCGFGLWLVCGLFVCGFSCSSLLVPISSLSLSSPDLVFLGLVLVLVFLARSDRMHSD
jgi:hypothetical protein